MKGVSVVFWQVIDHVRAAETCDSQVAGRCWLVCMGARVCMGRCACVGVHGVVAGSQGLVELSIADNWVEELPPECTGLTSLRSFSMCDPWSSASPRPIPSPGPPCRRALHLSWTAATRLSAVARFLPV